MEISKKKRIPLSEKLRLWPLSVLIAVRSCRLAFQAIPYVFNKTFLLTEVYRCVLFSGRRAWRLSRAFYQARQSEDIYCFGETPLVTLCRIQRRVGIDAGHRVLEVGSATGRNCFWLTTLVGCQVTGLEKIPEFVIEAQRIAQAAGCSERVQFVSGDLCDALPGNPDIIYLYGSTFEDETIRQFSRRCLALGDGLTVVTVSYPLTDYLPRAFELTDAFPASFTWGVTTVYVQRVVQCRSDERTTLL